VNKVVKNNSNTIEFMRTKYLYAAYTVFKTQAVMDKNASDDSCEKYENAKKKFNQTSFWIRNLFCLYLRLTKAGRLHEDDRDMDIPHCHC